MIYYLKNSRSNMESEKKKFVPNVDDSNGLSYKYECSNGTLWDCCIPFEGNECLLGTDENPEK